MVLLSFTIGEPWQWQNAAPVQVWLQVQDCLVYLPQTMLIIL